MRQSQEQQYHEPLHNPEIETGPMILRIFTLTLEPADPMHFSIGDLRSYLSSRLDEYTVLHKDSSSGFIHRYPAVQCRQIKNTLMAVGISQGADLLRQISDEQGEISTGEASCTITARDTFIRNEEFGITGTNVTYEFLTPWLALNQQNQKKFYDLKGKPERDAFMIEIIVRNLGTLAKSLDYAVPAPINCEAKVRFRRDRIDRHNVMVFLGKFRTNLTIPDYLGIGQSVFLGFGAIKRISEIIETDDEKTRS